MPRIWIWKVRFALFAALVALLNFNDDSWRNGAAAGREPKRAASAAAVAGTEGQGAAPIRLVFANWRQYAEPHPGGKNTPAQ